jgi:hypothetical protein
MATVAAPWHESMCPRRHLHSECPKHRHTQHLHPQHCESGDNHHHHGADCGQHRHEGDSPCNDTCRSDGCKDCKGCKVSCPVCLLMMSVVLLLAPPSAVAVANCGGHGALLASSSVPTCACDPGYSPSESDGGACVPDSDAPGSWAAIFEREGQDYNAQERMWAMLGKTPNQTLSGGDAVRLFDKLR